MDIQLGYDQIIFQIIDGGAGMSEKINFTKNREKFREITEIIKDSFFTNLQVDASCLSISSRYQNKKISLDDRMFKKKYYPFLLLKILT